MLTRIVLVSLTCLTVIGCEANAEISSPNQLKKAESKPIQPQVNPSAKPSSELEPKIASKEEKQSKQTDRKISTGTTNPVNNFGSFMTLTPTGKTNLLNNPLYELRLYANGQMVASLMTVSGRAHTQSRNRHQSGTQAPLPDGEYTVARSTVPGTIAEAGDRFLPIQPRFRTGRTDLGFHIDPSFEKNNGEDGTSGCIGLVSRDDLDKLVSFVRTYQPKFLDVRIQ